MQALEQRLNEVHTFAAPLAEIATIRREISEQTRRRVEECRHRLNRELPPDHPFRARIEGLLEKGDVRTAHEYIDAINRGLAPPPNGETRTVFSEFFPLAVRSLCDFLEHSSIPEVIRRIRDRRGFAGLDLAGLTGADTDRAATALKVWYAAKTADQISERQVQDVLTFLGFRVSEVLPMRDERGRWLRVKTVPLSSRDESPVPFYGSEAAGQYRVLCVWERPNEETLLLDVGEVRWPPVIVFFFGRLTEFRRRNLARLCRERRRTFVVLDDVLLLFLCTRSGVRLRPFFECALPFTFAEAYVTSSGPVPPEVFYGREAALKSILDPHGTCFIYGGRQLGKTALLREAARRFHAPEQGHIAQYWDLKRLGVGTEWDIDELWNILDRSLTDLRVGSPARGRSPFESFARRIEEWLNQDASRRFLLLLDEADRFLAQDGQRTGGTEFKRATDLKGLMENTGRRFKVVFAGLHDVQRTTNLANHPLAHYGIPICIGPLLQDGEWREARKLVEEPFAALGYRFEHGDLVSRILSQTNYYPSLIQLYCQQLCHHLAAQPSATHDWRTGPPFTITAWQVDEAYRSQDLRRAIRDRFIWTLQLDRRYEVIAYALALEIASLEGEERARLLVEGFDVVSLRRLATSWWPEGFETTRTVDAFRALLDEMVGLGVLRSVDNARYALRSPNVMMLLGTSEEIEAKLLEPREPEPTFAPTIMRSPMTAPSDERRSPFTWQQESLLLSRSGLFLIVGCAAAGLDDSVGRLEELFPTRARRLSGEVGREELSAGLRRRKGEEPVLIVDRRTDWDRHAVQAASELLRRKPADSIYRVIFLVDPARLWNLLPDVDESLEEFLDGLGGTVLSLGPWGEEMVRVWLDDCGFAGSAEDRAKVREETGYWPTLLYHLREIAARQPGGWAQALGHLQRRIQADSQIRGRLLEDFGLVPPAPVAILSWLALQEEVTEADIIDLLEETCPSSTIQRALQWGRLLNLVSYGAKGRLRLDPVARRLALASQE